MEAATPRDRFQPNLAAALLGVVTAVVFSPALGLVPVVLDPRAPSPGMGGSLTVNVALHALNAALVLVFSSRLFGRLVPSLVVAALFALHPLRVESVVGVAARELLGMTAALLAMLAYCAWARRGGARRYAFAVTVYALGAAATPLVSPVPVLLLLLDAWPLGRVDVAAPVRDARLFEKLPFGLLALASLLGPALASASPPATVGATVANGFATVARYVAMVAAPVGLTTLRPMPSPPWWTPGAVLVLCATTAGILALRMRAPASTIGWLWFLVAVAPVLALPPNDRFTYLPSLGLLIALVGSTTPTPHRRVAAGAALVAVAACVVTTGRQLTHWRDEEAVLRRALAVTEDNFAAERRLGALLAARGALDEAATHAREAVRLRPDDPEAQHDLGRVRLDAGHVDAAAEHFAAALATRPDFTRARLDLARAEHGRGRLDAAIDSYRQVLRREPDDVAAHVSLARALRERGELDEARTHFARALALGAPPIAVLAPFAQTLAEAGDLAGAADRYRALLALTPDDAGIHHRLGTIAARRGDLALAEAEYRAALRLRPDLADAQLHLGIVLAARGALTEALAAYVAALAIAPGLASAEYNRALTLEAMGDHKGAQAALRAELAVQPSWPPALVRLAALLAREGDGGRAEARELVRRATATLGEDDPEVRAVRRLIEDGVADSP